MKFKNTLMKCLFDKIAANQSSIIIVVILSFLNSTLLTAQSLRAYQPTIQQQKQAYKNAAQMDSLAKNSIFKFTVKAHWQIGGETFWYKNDLIKNTVEYLYVNALTGKKHKAFDHNKIAKGLSLLLDTIFNAEKLPITNMQFDKAYQHVDLQVNKKWFRCNLKTYTCTAIDSISMVEDDGIVRGNINSRWERQPQSDSLSPDKHWLVFTKEGNVFLQPALGGSVEQIKNDGDTSKPYGKIQWSPDSKHLVVFHINPVKEKPVYYILSSIDSHTRGVLKSNDYSQPGDTLTSFEMFLINVNNKKLVKVNYSAIRFTMEQPIRKLYGIKKNKNGLCFIPTVWQMLRGLIV